MIIENMKSAPEGSLLVIFWEHANSMFVRGDNSLQSAKKSEYGGALNAKELYPDIPVITLASAEFGKKNWA